MTGLFWLPVKGFKSLIYVSISCTSYSLNHISYGKLNFLTGQRKTSKIVQIEMIKNWFHCINQRMSLPICVSAGNFSISGDNINDFAEIINILCRKWTIWAENGHKSSFATLNCVNQSTTLSICVSANNFCINDDSSGTLSDIILSCCPLQTESCETAIILYYLNNRTDLYWGKISNRYWSFQPQSITPFFLSA